MRMLISLNIESFRNDSILGLIIESFGQFGGLYSAFAFIYFLSLLLIGSLPTASLSSLGSLLVSGVIQ